MKYQKPVLTVEQQVELLISRGMAGDANEMAARLATVSYYRLSAYWHPFRQAGTEALRPGTTFDLVWRRYRFDRELRLLVMDAVERIEVAARTQFTYHHAHAHGAFAYASDPTSLPYLNHARRLALQESLGREMARSKEAFVEHYKRRYAESPCLPIWMATEIMPFGDVVRMITNSDKAVRNAIAGVFGVPRGILESWLLTVGYARNICAHHGRLWNRVLSVAPAIPRDVAWTQPVVNGKRTFGLLTVCNVCLDRISPGHRWAKRLAALLDEYAEVPRHAMAIPQDWRTSSLWAPALA